VILSRTVQLSQLFLTSTAAAAAAAAEGEREHSRAKSNDLHLHNQSHSLARRLTNISRERERESAQKHFHKECCSYSLLSQDARHCDAFVVSQNARALFFVYFFLLSVSFFFHGATEQTVKAIKKNS
jgi:hypothetical protein